MIKRAVRILVLVAAAHLGLAPVARADTDPWLAPDKALHFGVSAGIAAGAYAAGAAVFDARGHALLAGAVVTVTAGAAKEALDLAGLGAPSWKDLAWDGIGCVAGLAAAWGIDLLVRGVSDARPLLERPRTGALALSF